MHDLQTAGECCVVRLRELGICCGSVIFALDTRARRRWGTCRRLPDGSFRIGVSPKLLEASREALDNTLYHELLHAATDCTGHTGRWKALAEYVSTSLGTDIKRTASWGEKGLDEAADTAVRYRYRCDGCGAQVVSYRACAFTKHYKRYRCGLCGGSFRKQD